MAEINVVTYRKHECIFSMEYDEGLRIFREYYSENMFGFVTKKSQQIAFLPCLNREEFELAHGVADRVIEHYKDVTGNSLKKINP